MTVAGNLHQDQAPEQWRYVLHLLVGKSMQSRSGDWRQRSPWSYRLVAPWGIAPEYRSKHRSIVHERRQYTSNQLGGWSWGWNVPYNTHRAWWPSYWPCHQPESGGWYGSQTYHPREDAQSSGTHKTEWWPGTSTESSHTCETTQRPPLRTRKSPSPFVLPSTKGHRSVGE